MSVLSVYWAPGHQRQSDIEYMQRLQPPAIRVLDPDPNQLVIAHKAAPKALLLPRDWALSEQHDDARRDPVGTGKRHAHDWRGKIDRWRAEGHTLPPDNQIIVVGLNEPRVWDMLPQVVEYTVAMLDECTQLGLRACALNLSVGWPANTGEGTPPDWKPYAPIEAAIKRGNHYLVLHEYWYRSGPADGWGWFAGRLQHCPWDVPIIIGECGIDMYVDMPRWENDGKPNRGWRGNVDAAQYANQTHDYARGLDRRVVAILSFLTDYRSNNWESFDTAEAHAPLLARAPGMMPQVQFGATHPTPPQPAPATLYVSATAGLKLRDEPVTGNVLAKIPYGSRVDVIAPDSDHPTWFKVRYLGFEGYAYSKYLGNAAPEQPQPVPSGDKWSRSIAFVLKQEGGLSTDRNDPGNYVNGLFIGTNFGISAAAHPDVDVVNLTVEQAKKIYEQSYWIPSGASTMPFPMCLAVLDLAVNGGVGRAKEALAATGDNFVEFMAWRIAWYTRLPQFNLYGAAWIRRCSQLMMEASK